LSHPTISEQPIISVRIAERQASIAIASVFGVDKYIGLSLIPNVAGNARVLSEIFFLIDRSGSMSGLPIVSGHLFLPGHLLLQCL
jgi:hypothetical protein